MSKTTTINIAELIAEVDAELKLKQQKIFDEQIDETINSLVREAVNHFKKRFRKSEDDDEDDNRYLYSKKEVVMFYKLNKNPKVKTRVEWDAKVPNKIFCYILYR